MRWLSLPTLHRAALAGALLIGTTASLAAQGTSAIRGRVTDAGTGRPIADVQVTVTGRPLGAVTNGAGDYAILQVPPGTYEVVARRIGYSRGNQTVVVSLGGEVRTDFSLRVTASTLDAVAVSYTHLTLPTICSV